MSPDVLGNGPSFIGALRKADIIENKMAAFFIAGQNYQSRVEIGGLDDFYLAKGDESSGYGMHWYQLTGTSWWKIKLLDAMYGRKSYK